MPLDITTKRVADVSDLPVKNADGSPMIDPDTGNPITAVVFGPATKIWQAADGLRRRKAIKRSREANGKFEATLDYKDEDTIEFLCAITKRFNGLVVNGVHGDADTVRAIYSDPMLGFIRDHMEADATNWENFMKASQSLSNSGSDNSPG
ncbi:hypothetical protein [Novosphingobium sp. HII-3]|uniref:hypothetical protein n=1 Tax=Novosphingobium sp. HII-3 TaxID=2075565 RepID=UPI000CDA96B6|nr:hypothetical protein [Novosphingobium sp. HII-3]